MIPTYPCSLSSSCNSNSNSAMPIIDLNIVDDHQSHELIFSPTHQPSSSSSSSLSSPSCPILFNPSHQLQDHAGCSYLESKNLKNDHDQACGKNIIAPSVGSSNDPDQEKGGGGVEIRKRGLKLKVWKRSSAGSGLSKEADEENNHNHNQAEDNYDSVKWMPSKMRMMRKMIVASSDHNHKASSSSSEDQSQNQYQRQQRPLLLSPRGNNNSSSSNNSSIQSNTNNNFTVRVCADCHTTKTPLWRSGPRGPKSLCNACGIRQRKARRAIAAAAAAAANGGSPDMKTAAEKSVVKGTYKVRSNKEKKLKFERETAHHRQIMKKKHKVVEDDDDDHQDKEANNNNSSGRSSPSSSSIINKFSSFEDFTVSLMSKNLAAASQVFPQDDKEAAILLMALSCNGLVHG